MLQEIEQGNMLSELLEQSREQRDSMETAAQGDYLRHLLQDSQALCKDTDALRADFSKLGISLKADTPVMLVLGRLTYPEGISYMDRRELLTSSRLIWNSHLAEMTRHAWVLDRHGDLLWLLQPLHNAGAAFGVNFARYLEGTLEMIQESCRQTLGLPVAFTVSGSACAWTETGRHYERLHRLQQMKIGDGISMVQIDRSGPPEPDAVRETGVRLHQRVENLAAHLDAGRRERFAETLEDIREGIHSGVSVEEAAELYYTVALVLLSHMNRSELYSLVNEYGKLMRLDEHSSLGRASIIWRGWPQISSSGEAQPRRNAPRRLLNGSAIISTAIWAKTCLWCGWPSCIISIRRTCPASSSRSRELTCLSTLINAGL